MNVVFENKGVFVPEIRQLTADAIWRGMNYIRWNFQTLIMHGLIYGGPGWYSLEQLPSWRWINSQEGFAQLGFVTGNEPIALLNEMYESFEVKTIGGPNVTRTSGKLGLLMKFFDIDRLAAATRHPAAGQGNLDANRSWFDWVWRGRAITEPAQFVRVKPNNPLPRSNLIAGTAKGIMTKYNTGGLWVVPPKFRLDLNKLIERNEQKIILTLEHHLVKQMNIYLRS